MSYISLRWLVVPLTLLSQSCSSIADFPTRAPYQEDPSITVLVEVIGNRAQNTSFVVKCDAEELAILRARFPDRKIVSAPRTGALPGVIVHLAPRTASIDKREAYVELTTTRQGQMLKKRFHLTRQAGGHWTIDDSDVIGWGW